MNDQSIPRTATVGRKSGQERGAPLVQLYSSVTFVRLCIVAHFAGFHFASRFLSQKIIADIGIPPPNFWWFHLLCRTIVSGIVTIALFFMCGHSFQSSVDGFVSNHVFYLLKSIHCFIAVSRYEWARRQWTWFLEHNILSASILFIFIFMALRVFQTDQAHCLVSVLWPIDCFMHSEYFFHPPKHFADVSLVAGWPSIRLIQKP